MTGPPMTTALDGYNSRLREMAEYNTAVLPYIAERRAGLRVLVEASIVLSVAYLDDFLKALVGTAAPHREKALRRYLTKNGSDEAKRQARTCDLLTLVKIAKSRLSFQKGGASIDGIFRAEFGFSPWPSEEVRDVILDLSLVRNMIIHAGSAEVGVGDVGQYARQIRSADVFTVSRYDELVIHRVDPFKALKFHHAALTVLVTQVDYLRKQLVESNEWLKAP